MVAAPDFARARNKWILHVLFLVSAIASLGLTFHFYGDAANVPGPFSQFGFQALAPIAMIDKVYSLFTHNQLYWDPVPMFLVLWSFYFSISSLLTYWLLARNYNK
jgi:hypothetical protein